MGHTTLSSIGLMTVCQRLVWDDLDVIRIAPACILRRFCDSPTCQWRFDERSTAEKNVPRLVVSDPDPHELRNEDRVAQPVPEGRLKEEREVD
jgi:hypothetical protein